MTRPRHRPSASIARVMRAADARALACIKARAARPISRDTDKTPEKSRANINAVTCNIKAP